MKKSISVLLPVFIAVSGTVAFAAAEPLPIGMDDMGNISSSSGSVYANGESSIAEDMAFLQAEIQRVEREEAQAKKEAAAEQAKAETKTTKKTVEKKSTKSSTKKETVKDNKTAKPVTAKAVTASTSKKEPVTDDKVAKPVTDKKDEKKEPVKDAKKEPDIENMTDEELQEMYFAELYGQVKEKAALRAVDKKALALAKDYKAAKNAANPSLAANGAVTHVFGSTIPRILCRPLRVTDIQLQPGETVTDAPAIGDSVNWAITPSSSGSGENLTVHILVKPTMPDLVTNLIVHTDRRTYVMELVSDRQNLTPLVAFTYPDDERKASWDSFIQGFNSKKASAVRNTKNGTRGAVVLNDNYTVTGKRYSWFPVEVVDDGLKTYITFPSTVAATEFPVFMVAKGKKRREVVNYRIQGQTMIIDRIFKTGLLRIGTGTAAETVYITRNEYAAESVAQDVREGK